MTPMSKGIFSHFHHVFWLKKNKALTSLDFLSARS